MISTLSTYTVLNFIEQASEQLAASDLHFGHGTDNPWDEAVAIIIHVLDLPPNVDRQVGERLLSDEQLITANEILERRIASKKPLAYILGYAWYMYEKYLVTEEVIIPRSPLGELLQNKLSPWLDESLADSSNLKILDLCCGSGCIGIAASKVFGNAKVEIADISAKAIAIAKQNINLHKVQNKVRAIQSDLFDNIQASNQYQVILSNPPYVPNDRKSQLPAEFGFEPDLALYSGEDGLQITRKILSRAGNYLSDDGFIIIEVGEAADNLIAKYPDIPFTWLEFANGGEGVFLLTKQQLFRAQYF